MSTSDPATADPATAAELLRRREAILPRGIPRITELGIDVGVGAELTTRDGRRLLDMATGIGVMTVGHGHPHVVRAICEQAERLLHVCMHVATYEPYLAVCEKLAALVPHGRQPGDEGNGDAGSGDAGAGGARAATKVMLVNSGAEAVENAIKIARQATRRSAVIVFTEAFHGRTLLAMTMTGKVGTKLGSGPYAPEIYRLPFPNHFRYGEGLSLERFVERELERLRGAFQHTVAAEQVAAVVIEPLQGEGGIVPCPPAYLRGLRDLCDEHGILLVCDEVQSGLTRTGRWASYEHAGVVPDLSTWAKALGGGLPLGAVVGRADVMDAAVPGTIGGTFGGNPVSCAAALAALEVMERESLNERAAALGGVLGGRLHALAERSPWVADARGIGAMWGIELCEGGDPLRPAAALTTAVLEACLAEGVLFIKAGTLGNVIRLLPPLTLADAELDRALSVLERAVLALAP